MVVTVLSAKNQTTVAMEFVKALGLAAGVRFKQWVEGNRIILEPIPDIMTLYGSLPLDPARDVLTAKEEEEAMEIAIAREAAGLEKDR